MPAYNPFTQSGLAAKLLKGGVLLASKSPALTVAGIGGLVWAATSKKWSKDNTYNSPGPYIQKISPAESAQTMLSTLWRPQLRHPMSYQGSVAKSMTGAAVGAGLLVGATTGIATYMATKSPVVSAGVALSSGIFGGYKGFKLAQGTINVFGNMAKAYYGLGQPKADYRAYGGGRGFRTWYKKPGGRMSPGHLGADGNLALALHKVRNRSVRR